MSAKDNFFLEQHACEGLQKQFECQLCYRVLKSKRSIMKHLFQQHGMSPLKSCYKLYNTAETKSAPRSTLYRWQTETRKSLSFEHSEDCTSDVQNPSQTSENNSQYAEMSDSETSDCTSDVQNPSQTSENNSQYAEMSDSETSDCTSDVQNPSQTSENNSQYAEMCDPETSDCTSDVQNPSQTSENNSQYAEMCDPETSDCTSDVQNPSQTSENNSQYAEMCDPETSDCTSDVQNPSQTSENNSQFAEMCDPETSDCTSDVQNPSQTSENNSQYAEMSDPETSDFSFTESSPTPSDYLSTTDVSLSETTVESDTSSTRSSTDCSVQLGIETDALEILHCFRKHKLTDSACHDILKTVKQVLPAVKDHPLLNYRKVLSLVPETTYKKIDYCCKCESIIQDGQNLQCTTADCFGVVKSFMLADLKELLRKLLISPGIFEDIKKTLNNVEQNLNSDTLSDIHDGEIYKKQFTGMNQMEVRLTGILNTDGVNLYKSTRVELWPVYLAINELNPSHRFSRENILLIALWQGKGKPPFRIYFESICTEINTLTEEGLQLETDYGVFTVYLTVIGLSLDLPAKAGVLNMTQFNGSEACITCEEPGVVVPQGRGHSRSYPYREADSHFPERSSENVLELMNSATVRNRQKGFKGLSGVARLSKFDLIYGTVPDYMHCVLLGIVKTLLSKWFSPTESGKDFFVGKHVKQINQRLLQIQPPHYIQRLPRDIEKHYANFKATELQGFLLFYGLVSLYGIQKDKFLEHFALLSEAIFLLLGDNITINCLERSQFLLKNFYCQFSGLYGAGSCGLNVHNACAHMPMYVRKLGPIWGWSCFAFEDANAMIVESIHGTGDVVKQALRKQEIAMYIRSSNNVQFVKSKQLKVSHQAHNCTVHGALKRMHNLPVYVIEALGVENCDNLRKVLRVSTNGQRFYSSGYTRMKKRNSYTVLFSENKMGQVQYFVLNLQSNLAYAVIKEINECHTWLSNFQAAKHLQSVVKTNICKIVSVDQLKATLLYMTSPAGGDEGVVVKMPNRQGHAIFK